MVTMLVFVFNLEFAFAVDISVWPQSVNNNVQCLLQVC